MKKFLPSLYFILIVSIFYYPNWTVIDPKAQHWFHLSVINSIYIFYIIFFEKESILKVFESNIFKSILGLLLISSISATYAINYIESIVKITDIYVLTSSVLIVLYFSLYKKVNWNILLYTILISLILDLSGSIYQIIQIVPNAEFSFQYSNAIKSIYGNKNIAAMVSDLRQYSFFIFPLIVAFIFFKFSINQSDEISLENRVSSIVINENDQSTSERFRFYSQAISYISSNPLLGCGIGNWKLLSIKYDSKTMYSYVVPYFAHNDFIEIFAETGFFGFLIYVLFFFFYLRKF